MAHNPISVIVPCHRVVGTDGSLTGYAGGIGKAAPAGAGGVDTSRFFIPKKGRRCDSVRRGTFAGVRRCESGIGALWAARLRVRRTVRQSPALAAELRAHCFVEKSGGVARF